MKSRLAFILLVALLAVLVGGMVVLFRLRLATGDVFPAYSSERADPLGTRAFHDALDRLPELSVERQVRSLRSLPPDPPRTILLAGLPVSRWKHLTRDEFDALDNAARAGSRIVITLMAAASEPAKPEQAGDKAPAKPSKDQEKTPKDAPEEPKIVYADPGRRWGVELKDRWLLQPGGGAVRVDTQGSEVLPSRLKWESDVYFAVSDGAGWRVLYRRGAMPVLIERSLGRGTLVVATDSYFLSNEALWEDSEHAEGAQDSGTVPHATAPKLTSLLAWIVGPNTTVVFDESHLGVIAHPGVAALARRYGLSGAFFTLLLLALLFAWQQMALFIPPVEDASEMTLGYHPAAGLEALLRRSVPPAELAETCATEWRRTASEADRARLDAALAATPERSAIGRYNIAVRALRKGRK